MSAFHDNMLLGASGAGGGYQIERSLRFNSGDSAYLSRTFGGSATSLYTYTISAWVKRSNTTASIETIFGVGTGSAMAATWLGFNSDTLAFAFNDGTHYVASSAVYRDLSAWYHIVAAVDTTQATASNRVKLYVNGVQITALGSANYPAQNTGYQINAAYLHVLGARYRTSIDGCFNGYITETHFIDGQALTPSSFGEANPVTGVWQPKKYTGTYGTNGFYLNFADNSGTTSTTLGKDSSGNGNNWTPNNFSVTAGAGNDSLIDTPTPYADGGNGRGNYATLNALDANGGSLSNGSLEYAGTYSSFSTQNGHGCRSTLRVRPSGKWYVEAANVTYSGSGNSCMLGFTSSTQEFTATAFGGTLTPWIGVDASVFNNRITLQWNGVSGGTASATQLFASYASGDVVNFAIDFDAGKFWVGKNGTWYNSGDPAAGTNATSTFTAGSSDWAFWGEYVVSSDNSNRGSVLVNFGQRSFSSTPPSGFLALNTQNLPEPSIKKPSSYFDTVLYTGDNTVRSISGLNFSPDFVWIKERSTSAGYHVLFDAVRGATKGLSSNATAAEITDSDSLTAFNSNGFSIGTGNTGWYVNRSSQTYVAWCWDESATPGFDIVTYTGDGTTSANRLIDHSLGVKPDFIITKKRSSGTTDYGWSCWHKDLGGNYGIWLNSTSARNVSMWTGYSNFSATKFTPPDLLYGNENGATYVNYLWSEVAGFSKFGSYTGNGSTDGPFVYCGFRPRWVMMKGSSLDSHWYIFDAARNESNVTSSYLYPDLSHAEYAEPCLDFTSNGFKWKNYSAPFNAPGHTYIFAAFAESPFKYSLAR